MAPSDAFRLPDTPPQGFTFPPAPATANTQQSTGDMEPAGRHSRKPSLTIQTRELTSPPQAKQLPPPPPPRALTIETGKPRSNSQPVRPSQPSPKTYPPPPTRKRDSLGNQSSSTPLHRSIFPRYNPGVVDGESYNPGPSNAPSPQPSQGDFQSTYAPSVYSTVRSPPMQQGGLSQAFAAPSASDSQCQLPSYRESMYGVPVVIQSNPTDVLDLWCLANGQDDQELALSYNLGLDCTDLTLDNELLCLTSTAGAVYTLRATSNSLNIFRTHPLHAATTLSVAAPTLYVPSDSSALLTTIFPITSKFQAIDSAASLAIAHGLGRTQASTLEREAITKAHQRTAAPVLWSKQTKSYYISFPMYTPNPDDPNDPKPPAHAALPIEINPSVSIRVLEPPSAHSATNPILTLSLPAKTLIVHSHALANLPSPYGADILISALLALILHLNRESGILLSRASGGLDSHSTAAYTTSIPTYDAPPTFAPPPRAASATRSSSRNRSRTRTRSPSRSRAGSRLEGLLHPTRPRAGTDSLALAPPSNLRSTSRLSAYSSAGATLQGSPPLAPPGTPGLEKGLNAEISDRGTAPELNARVTGLDLSRFQAYDLADPRLGAGTRAGLRVLYWGFGVLVWVLGVCVGVLAEAVVLVGGLGRKK